MQVTGPANAEHLAAVGQLIRRGRTDRGLSIDKAAARGSMSAPTWGNVERGQTARPATYQAIARALGIEPTLIERAIADPGALGQLDKALAMPSVDLTTVPYGALLAELDRRLASHQDD